MYDLFDEETIKRYIRGHELEGIILDTNILILLLVGFFNPSLITTYKALVNSNKHYSEEDYTRICEILSWFGNKLIITPQVLSEISSLIIKDNQGLYKEERDKFISSVIAKLKSSAEHHLESVVLWGKELKILRDFGLTDMNLFEISKIKNIPILTDDVPFYLYAYKDIPIINYQSIKHKNLTDNITV